MKIEINDDLGQEAVRRASELGCTVQQYVETLLRQTFRIEISHIPLIKNTGLKSRKDQVQA